MSHTFDTPVHQKHPVLIPTDDRKIIAEHFGVAAGTGNAISVARMVAPPGWSEPRQTPEFQEFTLMCSGRKRVELPDGAIELAAGESLMIPPGVTVRYSNPFSEEAVYWSVCLPAFTPETVHRQEAEEPGGVTDKS